MTTTLTTLTNRNRLSITIDVALALSMLFMFTAAVFGLVVLRGIWPPRASAPPSLHSGVQ